MTSRDVERQAQRDIAEYERHKARCPRAWALKSDIMDAWREAETSAETANRERQIVWIGAYIRAGVDITAEKDAKARRLLGLVPCEVLPAGRAG